MSSEDIVAAAARTSQAAQFAELNSLDGKAGNLIGFAGIALTLTYTSAFADGHWTWALRRSFKIGGAVGAFLDQAGRRGTAQRMLVARASRHVAIQRRVQGRIRTCRSF